MESFGTVLGGEWNSLDAMYSTEESEFMAQLLDYCSIPKDLYFGSNFRIPSENTNVNTCFLPTSNSGSYIGGDFDQILAMNDDFVMKYSNVEANESTPSPVQISDDADINENIVMQLGREDRMPVLESYNEVAVSNAIQTSKKRCGNSAHVQKNRKNVKARKKQKLESTDCTNVENVAAVHKQSSSSYSSEDDSIASQELNGATSNSSDSKEAAVVNLNGKTRAVRGSATDPQSLYAKKRRERINERLRTLQNLVPNGTKVDISTMLEDAVQYVKFLQLQIKLLSSDDTWMYAPIAYNGTDLLS